MVAETCALPEDLKMAYELNISHLIMELDAQAVVNIFHSIFSSNFLINPLIAESKKILEKIPHKQIKHVFREANQYTDSLANLGLQQHSLIPPSLVALLWRFFYQYAIEKNTIN